MIDSLLILAGNLNSTANAALIAELRGKDAALAYLCRVESDTCEPVTAAPVSYTPVAAAPAPGPAKRPEWCYNASRAEIASHPQCR